VCIFPEGVSPLYTGVTPGSISKWQGGLGWPMHWRKSNGKIRYWRTETAYEAMKWG